MMCDIDYVDGEVNYEEEILNNKTHIIQLALDNVCDQYFDGVVFMDIDTGELSGHSMSQNESVSLDSHLVEVYRLRQGFDKEDCAECVFCEDGNEDGLCCDEDMLDECVEEVLLEDFNASLDDIVDGVLGFVEEMGYDLL